MSDPSRILATNWSTNSSSVCSWHGVTCSISNQRVSALNLSSMNLLGTIPPQLGQLSFLDSLDLSSNLFKGALPSELSLLHRLKFISLRLNTFTGDIPPLFSQLAKLEYLDLSNNSFIGSIPKLLSNLTNLQFLDLSSNSLSGEIPQELGMIKSLQDIQIQYNRLSGDIPSAMFNMSSLVTLEFTGNELSGSLPTNMCTDLGSLVGLYLSQNRLSGPIPTNLSRCSRLEVLSLSYNSLTGHIPSQIGYLTALQRFYLGGNNFSGMLPQGIGNLQRLLVFGVERNQIGGWIDFSIFINMSSLRTLSLGRNEFTGNLLRDVGNLTTLRSFQISENYFSGVIPAELGQLYQLDELHLNYNTFSGQIPNELFNISSLRILSLVTNNLSGVLPSHLCHGCPILEELYLHTNSMTGSITNTVSKCSQLRRLSLSDNRFSGYIPTDLGNLRLLQHLDIMGNNLASSSTMSFFTSLANCGFLTSLAISDNPLHGIIPTSVGNLSSSLQQFYAYNCMLRGSIPFEIGNLSGLTVLSFYGNELSGYIPSSIRNLQELQGLFLDENVLGASIPEAICDLDRLSSVDISWNQFSGPIPVCLGKMDSLRHVVLEHNMLNSSIPSSLWGLKDLITLDLSENSLTGFLPEEISGLGAAIYVVLAMNQLSGSIPGSIGKLQSLVELSLENNSLEGSIPVSMGSMLSLATLDLSYNNLSGSLPKSLQTLQYLSYFNVSFNGLSGEIPSGGPFVNFTVDSFEGNEALCGIPRFHVRICSSVSDNRPKRKKVKLALYIVLGIVAFISVVSLVFICVRNNRKQVTGRLDYDIMMSNVRERISYYELMQATEQLSENNLLGTGSSCSVYKGVLKNGKVIAVKVFNMQLEAISRRFDVECEILCNIRHRNLTSVISSCSNEEFKALVLEYMPKGNLEKWLYSHNYCLSVLERLDIMIDVASALEYLHYGCSTPIAHSDMKPSNVLLDEDMVAHISDFGISKLLCNGDSFVQTNTLGTLGYIAPEYGSEGLVSTRGDVYSYGVMLMETFTRKRPSDDMFGGDLSLKRWVEISVPHMASEVIDANLLEEKHFDMNLQCICSILELALKCCAENPSDRINIKEAQAQLHKIKVSICV